MSLPPPPVPWHGPNWLNVDIFQIVELESFVMSRCPIFYSSVWIRVLVFSHFMTLYVTAGYYILAPMRRELYILFMGFGMLFDLLLNWGLSELMMEHGPYWTEGGCGANQYNTPDPYIEEYTFVFVSIIGYYVIHGVALGLYERLTMSVMLALLAVAQSRLGFSSPRQIALAAVIGTVEGAIFQLVGVYVFVRYSKWLRNLWIVKFLGYSDTMFLLENKQMEDNNGDSLKEMLHQK